MAATSQGKSVTNRAKLTVTTPSERVIEMTRVFDAPRRLVFEALTRPEHIKRWWGCLGDDYSVPVAEADLRPGGKWRTTGRNPDGSLTTFYGEYREVAPPGRLVYTEIFEPYPDAGSLVTVVLTEEHGKTRLTLTAEYPSAEVRDVVLGTGMEHGAGLSYDRMEDLLAELVATT